MSLLSTLTTKHFLEGVLDKNRFLDIIKNFIFFEHKDDGTNKILAQYHQYFAVHKAVHSTLEAVMAGDGREEFLAHSRLWQVSFHGFYAHSLIKQLGHPTFVVLTDRNDLDTQLLVNLQGQASS